MCPMAEPAPTFVAYIDESGCEGFAFTKGSSEWFVISAVVARDSNRSKLRDVSDEMKKVAGKRKDVKFSQFSGPKRARIIEMIAQQPLRAVTVFVHKPELTS